MANSDSSSPIRTEMGRKLRAKARRHISDVASLINGEGNYGWGCHPFAQTELLGALVKALDLIDASPVCLVEKVLNDIRSPIRNVGEAARATSAPEPCIQHEPPTPIGPWSPIRPEYADGDMWFKFMAMANDEWFRINKRRKGRAKCIAQAQAEVDELYRSVPPSRHE